jgi:putative ABC transport system permease protein
MFQAVMWLKGVVTHRLGRLLGTMIGVSLIVAFVATIGAFLTTSNAQMTKRAIHDVPVDWQVQLASSADERTVRAQLEKAVRPQIIERVSYAQVNGYTARTGGTVQTTGPGRALGVSREYRHTFPGEFRLLLGSMDGVLLAQQTAANLHATVGDPVQILRVGLPPVETKVDGIVDLPNADSLFQAVGVPANVAPQAPPDNVIILPDQLWRSFFLPQIAMRPDSVRIQFHTRLGYQLPSNPDAAYTAVTGAANNLEARIAGSGIVANNLASRLLGVREDALYARVLFLFLGLPGVILVTWLTLAVATSGSHRRAQEQALLRVRGASVTQVVRLETVEAFFVGLGGVLLGVGLTLASSGVLGNSVQSLRAQSTLGWIAGASLVGLLLALSAVIIPAWLQARRTTVAAARAVIRPVSSPLWQQMWLDLIALAIGGVEFWRTASSGYQVVLAPEGVAANSVNYEAFIAPLCLWIGGVLLCIRLSEGGLRRGRRALTRLLAPLNHSLAGLVAASLSRQRVLMTRGIILIALAISFSVSTALFNATYNAQSRIDAELTNGADVTVTGPTAGPPSTKLAALRAMPGVLAAQPMQHRFAYVGNDLQDMYGIDPRHVGDATKIANAYFAGGDARATLAALANTPDGVLVSEETVTDFQLQPGDKLNLRVQSARDHRYHVMPFSFVGVVREFPTAPTDSFLVVNSKYLAQQSGTGAAETVLLRTQGDPAAVAARARELVRDIPGAKVTDLGSVQRAISSSLTAVDLRGLTRLELAFAIVLVAGATGLILALGLVERRRTFAILTAIGAKSGQLGAFLWGEALLMLFVGGGIGAVLGLGVAQTLVKVLTGIFDPPPERLAVPWGYLLVLGLAAAVSTIIAVVGVRAYSRRQVIEALRGL